MGNDLKMRSTARFSTLLVLTAVIGCAPVSMARDPGTGEGALLPSLQIYTDSDEVNFVLQVTNTGNRPIELRFPDGQSHEFVVLQGEREIWKWSDDQMFTQAVRVERLGVGESRRFEGIWRPASDRSGEFIGIGRLTSEGSGLEQATRFTLD